MATYKNNPLKNGNLKKCSEVHLLNGLEEALEVKSCWLQMQAL